MREYGSPPGTLALSKPLALTVAQLKAFTSGIYTNPSQYQVWVSGHHGAFVDSSIADVVLRGASHDPVVISNVTVVDKTCTKPFAGTYFEGYTQGGKGPDQIQIQLNLDDPNPYPQELLALSTGFKPDGYNYFQHRHVTLSYGQTITLTFLTKVSLYACTYALSMTVDTGSGSVTERIDNDGQPFALTGAIAPKTRAHPYSGYQRGYSLVPANSHGTRGWHSINPADYAGRR